ncbi:MAG TPA: dihydrodipicolinate synthase family protein [Solirubrobacteraceae bacterium]|nr:dihydrodipicolinate synthase family protein [Solirubrobacteraceae bacterium]
MTSERITGTLAAAVTPLRDDGTRLDEDALHPLLDFYGAAGLNGALVLGTTGEGVLLRDDERRRVAELAVAGAGGLRIVVHCGAQTTAQTTALSAHAAEAGADGVAVIAPPYFGFDAEELLEHLAGAAAACAPLPFYVYEYADRSGYAIPIAVIERLRERAGNLAGMKVSDAPFERVAPYLKLGLDVFIGMEPLIPRGMEHGAVGAVSGVAAAFPEAVAALVREPTDAGAAVVEALRRILSADRFQASVKAALGARGLPVRGDVRAPLRPLAAERATELRAELERVAGAQSLGPVVGA